jgi:hypothetical protein
MVFTKSLNLLDKMHSSYLRCWGVVAIWTCCSRNLGRNSAGPNVISCYVSQTGEMGKWRDSISRQLKWNIIGIFSVYLKSLFVPIFVSGFESRDGSYTLYCRDQWVEFSTCGAFFSSHQPPSPTILVTYNSTFHPSQPNFHLLIYQPLRTRGLDWLS